MSYLYDDDININLIDDYTELDLARLSRVILVILNLIEELYYKNGYNLEILGNIWKPIEQINRYLQNADKIYTVLSINANTDTLSTAINKLNSEYDYSETTDTQLNTINNTWKNIFWETPEIKLIKHRISAQLYLHNARYLLDTNITTIRDIIKYK